MRSVCILACAAIAWCSSWNQLSAQGSAADLINRAIQAHGGEERLTKFAAIASRGTGTVYVREKAYVFAAATLLQWPSQLRNEMNLDLDGREISNLQVLDGSKGWVRAGSEVVALGETQIREMNEQLYAERVATLVVLRQPGFRLQLGGEAPVKGKDAQEVKVTAPGHRDISLYFDKVTHLLVKCDTRVFDFSLKKEVLQEKIASEFHTADGIVGPRKVVVYRDGEKLMEMEIVEYRRLAKLDDSLFAAPK